MSVISSDEFFNAIRKRCSGEEEYATELLKARGFLLEDEGMKLSDNSHPEDEAFLRRILKAENIGTVQDGKINISSFKNIENIFKEEYVGGGEAFCTAESWQKFLHDSYAPKVPMWLLDPFVSRYIKAISACGVRTCSSCDGNHPGESSFGRIIIEYNDDCNSLWNAIICKRCLNPRIPLNWKKEFKYIKFDSKNQWQTYLMLNQAAELLYDNRITLRRIRRQASDDTRRVMTAHTTKQDLAKAFAKSANKLMDETFI